MTIGRREQAWGVAKAHVAATDLFANLCEAALKIGSSCTFTTALLLLYYCFTDLFDNFCEAALKIGLTTALLLLYYCFILPRFTTASSRSFTTILLWFNCCFTTVLLTTTQE
jgi:hypothetical protein